MLHGLFAVAIHQRRAPTQALQIHLVDPCQPDADVWPLPFRLDDCDGVPHRDAGEADQEAHLEALLDPCRRAPCLVCAHVPRFVHAFFRLGHPRHMDCQDHQSRGLVRPFMAYVQCPRDDRIGPRHPLGYFHHVHLQGLP